MKYEWEAALRQFIYKQLSMQSNNTTVKIMFYSNCPQ